jgi:hypothetical protein
MAVGVHQGGVDDVGGVGEGEGGVGAGVHGDGHLATGPAASSDHSAPRRGEGVEGCPLLEHNNKIGKMKFSKTNHGLKYIKMLTVFFTKE